MLFSLVIDLLLYAAPRQLARQLASVHVKYYVDHAFHVSVLPKHIELVHVQAFMEKCPDHHGDLLWIPKGPAKVHQRDFARGRQRYCLTLAFRLACTKIQECRLCR
jgi:hypothetical protein